MRKLLILALAATTLAGAEAAVLPGSPFPGTELFPVEPGINAERGFAVAVDGDWLAMGAPRDDEEGKDAGAVYLFHWSGTIWDQTAKLLADPPQPNAQLGFALAMRDGVLAAAALGEGAVYIFVESDGVWTPRKRLVVTGHGARTFGRSLAFDGNRLAVGAVAIQGVSNGAVYLYDRDSWTLEQMVQPRLKQAQGRFGSAVSLAGNLLVVGAPGYDAVTGSPAANAGAAYVFQRGSGRWREKKKLLPPESPSPAGYQFGSAVAADGSEIFVGAPTADLAGANSGAVYWFVQAAGDWVRHALPDIEGLGVGEQLGASLSLSGGLLAAGAPAPPPGTGAGKLHVFRRTDAVWFTLDLPQVVNAEDRDLAGISVAVDGVRGRVVMGGVLGDQGDGAAGAVWSFHCSAEGCVREAEAMARDLRPGISFGKSVAMTPQFLAVGAPRDDGSSPGRVYLYRRAGNGWRQEARLISEDPFDGFGSSVALDGERLVVGAPRGRFSPASPPVGDRTGLVYIFSHHQGSWAFEIGFRPEPAAPGEAFGTSVALVDNGASPVVVAIGAPRGASAGAVYVVEKIGDEWLQTGALTSGQQADRFGASVSLHHNRVLNKVLLAIGAPGEDNGAGAVHIFVRGETEWTFSERLAGFPEDLEFGSSVSLRNGRLAAGAPGSGTVNVFKKVGGVFKGHGTQLPSPEETPIPRFGASLSLLRNRLAVGAPDPGGRGRAFLFDVESEVLTELMPLQSLAGDGLGTAVALSTDFLVVMSPGQQQHAETVVDRATVKGDQ